ncbi:hypothetical protein BU24DRAFT_52556 [Aaosphaeria arxii CBS 175.79]|uniref:MYND-type domain-containing protein n=1 Tax=Aaosphaeria arxii CBS 175.79 TaxID=1450172 RepID=A0A6A5XDI5_9PLEO|nr:uncharacterized protein BU24DRAFT_52556 [Aaosphaeria arxii CBS 175.79]KAF2011072.1 hypothetical protein BU24DRAFT_52556 [Aaosphaeria arxii CBS 175.79]
MAKNPENVNNEDTPEVKPAELQTKLCEICDKVGSTRCGACKVSRYCSGSCQKEGWSKHKLVCKSFQEYSDFGRPPSKGPGSIFRRAVLFHPDEEKPRFVWVEFKREDIFGDGLLYDNPQLKGFGIDAGGIHYILENARLGRELPHCLLVRYRDNFMNDGSKVNKAIWKTLRSDVKNKTRDWRGPVLVYGLEGVDHEPVPSIDLDTSDFRDIVDWLNTRE